MEQDNETERFPIREFAAGTTIVQQGDAATSMYVLLEGRLRVAFDGVVLAEISDPGSLVGEISLLLGSERGATVIAETESRLEVIEDVDRYFRDPQRALGLARLLAQRLAEMSTKYAEANALAVGDETSSDDQDEDPSSELDSVRRYLKAWRITI